MIGATEQLRSHKMYRILIIEDDRTIAGAVKSHLEKWGFEARCIENFKDILSDFSDYSPHLVLMDIGLPFYNGFYWCAEIRRVSKVPVVFLSSASDNMNIVMAMNMGGDDFIAKPFDLTVLMAKIQSILRRTYDFGNETSVITHKGEYVRNQLQEDIACDQISFKEYTDPFTGEPANKGK